MRQRVAAAVALLAATWMLVAAAAMRILGGTGVVGVGMARGVRVGRTMPWTQGMVCVAAGAHNDVGSRRRLDCIALGEQWV